MKRPSTAMGPQRKRARGEALSLFFLSGSQQQPPIPPHHPVLARSSYTVEHPVDRCVSVASVWSDSGHDALWRCSIQASTWSHMSSSKRGKRCRNCRCQCFKAWLSHLARSSSCQRHCLSRQLELARSSWLLVHMFFVSVQQSPVPLLESPAQGSEVGFVLGAHALLHCSTAFGSCRATTRQCPWTRHAGWALLTVTGPLLESPEQPQQVSCLDRHKMSFGSLLTLGLFEVQPLAVPASDPALRVQLQPLQVRVLDVAMLGYSCFTWFSSCARHSQQRRGCQQQQQQHGHGPGRSAGGWRTCMPRSPCIAASLRGAYHSCPASINHAGLLVVGEHAFLEVMPL
eukprot:6459860-Amphidinium_carterae.1